MRVREFFQLVEKADGELYRLDLDRLLSRPLRPLDTERACTLARFLADVHADKRAEPTLYHRRVRELLGHGECLMGILDSYPHPYPLLPTADCEALERDMVSWRWRLRRVCGRCRRGLAMVTGRRRRRTRRDDGGGTRSDRRSSARAPPSPLASPR